MTNTDIKFLIVIGIPSIGGLVSGMQILNKKKTDKTSNFYMDINLLLTGILGMPLFLASLLFFWLEAQGASIINKKTFYMLASAWGTMALFIPGLHGILNRNKIKSPSFLKLCVSQVISSIIGIVGVIAFCMKWGWR